MSTSVIMNKWMYGCNGFPLLHGKKITVGEMLNAKLKFKFHIIRKVNIQSNVYVVITYSEYV